jgi:S-adenosylmethionine decarboxylase
MGIMDSLADNKIPDSIHIIADFCVCPVELLENGQKGEEIIWQTVKESGLSCILVRYHQFTPGGYTAAALLAESHLTIHTWPEHKSAQVDIFTCGSHAKAKHAYRILKRIMSPEKISEKLFIRSLDKIEEKKISD